MTIKLPEPLTTKEKEKIKASYEQAIIDSGHEEEEYVKNKFKRFLSRFRNPQGHELLVVKISNLFFQECFGEGLQSDPMNGKAKKQIISALFYAVNPYDVIPDFIPGRGYLDDALVINLCLNKLRFSAPELYQRVKEAIFEQQEGASREQQSEH